jgi:hypothetical protein
MLKTRHATKTTTKSKTKSTIALVYHPGDIFQHNDMSVLSNNRPLTKDLRLRRGVALAGSYLTLIPGQHQRVVVPFFKSLTASIHGFSSVTQQRCLISKPRTTCGQRESQLGAVTDFVKDVNSHPVTLVTHPEN